MLASVCKKWLFQVHTSDCLDSKRNQHTRKGRVSTGKSLEREGVLQVRKWPDFTSSRLRNSMAGFEVVKQVGDLLVCQWFVLGLVLCWLPPAPYINVVRGVSLCVVLVAILVW